MAPALLLLAGKSFGVFSSFRHLCSACVPNTPLLMTSNGMTTSA